MRGILKRKQRESIVTCLDKFEIGELGELRWLLTDP